MEPTAPRSGGFPTAGSIGKPPLLVFALLFLLFSILPAVSSFAGARHFTYIYEAPTSAPGGMELENWVTWQRGTNPSRFDELDFRHELEFGVTNRFQISVYLADWNYQQEAKHSGYSYSDSALELIYNLSNPVADSLGLSIYEEIKGGDRFFELESKLIVQKNLGPLIVAYNTTLEAIWEGHGLQQRQGEFQQSLGASYELSPRFSVGIEMLHEVVFPEWRDEGKLSNFFIGPNISVRRGRWFATVTALMQATDTPDEPDFQLRTIFGVGL